MSAGTGILLSVMDASAARPFAHLGVPLHETYRRVMAVFRISKQSFVVHLRPEDVTEALRGDGGPLASPEDVQEALTRLEEWGNLRATPDTSRVTTVEDFYRTRYLYQLSREGEAAERALEVYEQEIGRRAELQVVALEDIRLRLRALAGLAADPDPAVVHNLLLELSGRLDSLAANATAFMSGLQRTIDLQDIDEEAFLAYKDRLLSYLERFVSELVIKSSDIAALLRSVTAERAEQLFRMAALREAADVAPGAVDDRGAAAGGTAVRGTADGQRAADPGAPGLLAPDPLELKLRAWRSRWSGIWSWFCGDRAHPSQSSLLRQRARKAIPDLLATISVLQERRAGRSDRSADFRALARWFAVAPTEDDAHRLWRAAFGLSPSRHLSGETPQGAVTANASWLDAPPLVIAARLRATGRYERRGAPSKIRDRSAQRERLARQVAAEREQVEVARRRLATGRPARLSGLGDLDSGEFGLFIRVLGEALSAGPPGRDGIITTRTADGSMEITLRPLDDGTVAEIRTVDGVLRGPDHEMTITSLTRLAVPPQPTGRAGHGVTSGVEGAFR
jgi:uncharacterized protein (TIGR02677 family)